MLREAHGRTVDTARAATRRRSCGVWGEEWTGQGSGVAPERGPREAKKLFNITLSQISTGDNKRTAKRQARQLRFALSRFDPLR